MKLSEGVGSKQCKAVYLTCEAGSCLGPAVDEHTLLAAEPADPALPGGSCITWSLVFSTASDASRRRADDASNNSAVLSALVYRRKTSQLENFHLYCNSL